jgi:predicted RNA-binding Zn-ribbon protein involved in translation (DUF1610 family)
MTPDTRVLAEHLAAAQAVPMPEFLVDLAILRRRHFDGELGDDIFRDQLSKLIGKHVACSSCRCAFVPAQNWHRKETAGLSTFLFTCPVCGEKVVELGGG